MVGIAHTNASLRLPKYMYIDFICHFVTPSSHGLQIKGYFNVAEYMDQFAFYVYSSVFAGVSCRGVDLPPAGIPQYGNHQWMYYCFKLQDVGNDLTVEVSAAKGWKQTCHPQMRQYSDILYKNF